MSFWHTWLQAQNVLLCLEFSSILFRTRHNRDWISFLPPVFLQTVQSVSSPAAQTPFWLLFFSWKTCWLCKLPYSLDCMFFFFVCVLLHHDYLCIRALLFFVWLWRWWDNRTGINLRKTVPKFWQETSWHTKGQILSKLLIWSCNCKNFKKWSGLWVRLLSAEF